MFGTPERSNTSIPDSLAPRFRATQQSEAGERYTEDLLHTARPSGHKRCTPACSCALLILLLLGGAGGGVVYLWRTNRAVPQGPDQCAAASVTMVQSIPVGDFEIKPVAGALATHVALTELADSASASLDLTAMYMDLTGEADRKIFNASEMRRFGAEGGERVYQALLAAAKRGVSLRILLGTLQDPINSTEVRQLLKHPSVQARTWDPTKWYGGGIMHLKLWHADGRAAYLGSANADWKSLAQVKELGVLINGSATGTGGGPSPVAASAATADLGRIFEVFWRWADPALVPKTAHTFSPSFQADLTLPDWDPALPASARRNDDAPFGTGPGAPLAALSSLAEQQWLCLEGEAAPSLAFMSASPGGALTAGRTPDLDALLSTIRSAETDLSLSVMDFLPASGYSGGHGSGPVWWPELVDAVLAVAYAKPVKVRVLVSKWAHTSATQDPAMRRLADGLAACKAAYKDDRCKGSLEVKEYEVPGWKLTEGRTIGVNATAAWPSFTRVNHAKFIVSDSRLNVGTSNWEWGYFHQTAGASWNTNASSLVAAAQAVFDRDWQSKYATVVHPA
jgi:phospholipase D3/4